MPTCVVCERTHEAWLPHPLQHQCNSAFTTLMDAVGSDLSVFHCPLCRCSDRDRHLWLYMTAIGLPPQLNLLRVLHIAPEAHIEHLIDRHKPKRYVRGDLFPTRANVQKVNVETLEFEDQSFDLIICNHVLEHVTAPERALSEFHRCLSAGGLLIAQTPYSPLLKKTFEIKVAPSPDFAMMFFGQNDHVRLFGDDIADYFHASDFSGELLSHASVLGNLDPKEYGVNAREPLFAFSKASAQ